MILNKENRQKIQGHARPGGANQCAVADSLQFCVSSLDHTSFILFSLCVRVCVCVCVCIGVCVSLVFGGGS